MNLHQIKLYTLLLKTGLLKENNPTVTCLSICKISQREEEMIKQAEAISKASDRVNFETLQQNINPTNPVPVRHLISGQCRTVQDLPNLSTAIIDRLNAVAPDDAQKAFWWLWRFYPEYLAKKQSDALLFPASPVIPDCPLHSSGTGEAC